MNTKDLLKELNKNQKEAVMHNGGPLLIIAGAGTGKTKVITTKIAYLISEKLAKPDEILALTFTEKAAQEMEERVDILVPYGYTNVSISTFHSFGDRILRENSLDASLSSDFKVLDESSQAIFLRDHLFEFDLDFYRPLGNPTKYIKALISFFSRLKDETIFSEDLLKYAKSKIDKNDLDEENKKIFELAKAYDMYETLMRESGNIDYGDQILRCIEIFKKNRSVLSSYQKKFKYILVDEYQDTNYAQNEFLKMLAKKSNITVVGDDDQSIFRFRGAAVSNILDFKKTYPKAKEIVLMHNYRSTQKILDSAYNLIQHNNPDRLEVKYKINKKLKGLSEGENIKHIHCGNYLAEADHVVQIIKDNVNTKKYSYKDFAILFRANNHSESFIQALNATGIPYKFSGGSGLYQRPEIRNIISFIKALVDFNDNLSFYHLASSEIYGINPSNLLAFNAIIKRTNKPFRIILQDKSLYDELKIDDKTKDKLENILLDLEKISKSITNHTAGELIYKFIKDTGYLSKLLKESTVSNELKVQNIARFFDKINSFEQISFDKSIVKFKEYQDMLLEVGENPELADLDPDIDAVSLLTLHKSKGLEFNTVFMVNLIDGRFPQRGRSETITIPEEIIKENIPSNNHQLQEERRLFYVGITRAKKELYFTNSDNYGGKRNSKISQFVLESLDKPYLPKNILKTSPENFIKRFKKSNPVEIPASFFTKDNRLNLSPHQIDDYLSCPLKFKYIHILKVPILKNHAVHYGSAVHSAVEKYFTYKLNKKDIALEELWGFFERAWVSEGFITREHEEERLRIGRETLKNFYENQKIENKIPSKIEEKFDFDILFDNGNKVRVNGRFDVIFENNNFIEVSDFKTSLVKEKEKADIRAKQSMQLAIYALACKEIYGKLPDLVSLYFIEGGVKGETIKTEKDMDKLKQQIFEVSENIRKKQFDPAPSFKQCDFCAYKDICPFTETKF